jgi:anti-sigma B factor antagonist
MLIDKVLSAGTRQILLNLTGVPIIDSMGIGEIVRAYNKVREAGGSLKLVGLTHRVYGALKITQLLDLIESYKTEAEAVGSFNQEKVKKTRGRKKKTDETAASGEPNRVDEAE